MKVVTEEISTILSFNVEDGVVINSLAGTGKTSLLEELALGYYPQKILYLVYNRAMLMQAVSRFERFGNVHVETFHSLAKKYLRIDDGKISDSQRIIDVFDFMRTHDHDVTIETCRDVLNNINLFCSSKSNFEEFYARVDDNIKDLFHFYWSAIVCKNEFIPYLHDYYLKEFQLQNSPTFEYDYVFVDESQDLTGCMVDIALSQSSKKIFIGDPHQDIYGWRFSSGAICELSNQYPCFKLTRSFRCSERVASVARTFLNILGESGVFSGVDRERSPSSQIAYIARTNMGLFRKASSIPPQKKIFYVGGFEGYKFDVIKDVYYLFNNNIDCISSSFIKSFDSKSAFISYVNRAKEHDLYTISNIVQKTNCVEALVDKIMSQITENIDEADVVLTTAHKSKGLEFDNVELLDDFFDIKKCMVMNAKIPSEEIRLIYVSVTRAKYDVVLPSKLCINDKAVVKIVKLVQ